MCGLSLRLNEVEYHLQIEFARLHKISQTRSSSQRPDPNGVYTYNLNALKPSDQKPHSYALRHSRSSANTSVDNAMNSSIELNTDRPEPCLPKAENNAGPSLYTLPNAADKASEVKSNDFHATAVIEMSEAASSSNDASSAVLPVLPSVTGKERIRKPTPKQLKVS